MNDQPILKLNAADLYLDIWTHYPVNRVGMGDWYPPAAPIDTFHFDSGPVLQYPRPTALALIRALVSQYNYQPDKSVRDYTATMASVSTEKLELPLLEAPTRMCPHPFVPKIKFTSVRNSDMITTLIEKLIPLPQAITHHNMKKMAEEAAADSAYE